MMPVIRQLFMTLAQMGTLVKIKQMLRLPGGIVRVLVEGITRIRNANITSMDPYYMGLRTSGF